ncbi:hypothetical protein ACFL0G_02225 [Candidatus Zixiibacteriota bacterium]
MKKTIPWIVVLLLICTTASFGSQINRITLSELHAKADFIVLAKVTELVKEGDQDQVAIQVDSYLKGESPQTVYNFSLVTRGGLKDFDPALKIGDTGVFFLKLKKQEGQVEKAYWGGVATFQKNHFDLTEKMAVATTSVITSPDHPDSTDKQWIPFENDLYKFVQVSFGHQGDQQPGFYVFSKTRLQWLRIDQVTTADALLGRSPTFEECREANTAPPSVGWDFKSFKEERFIPLPLRHGSFIAFPDDIAYDKKTGFWILSFMSNWNIEGVKTVLKFKQADLDAAFKALADPANLDASFDAWRSYRIEQGQIQNSEDYERGFQKGFAGPPGLVDGSADFNLGHSDGMQAKMGIFPEE